MRTLFACLPPRFTRFLLAGLSVSFGLVGVPNAPAQDPVVPTIPETTVEVRRGQDIVQPLTVFSKVVHGPQDAGAVPVDSLGVLRIPRSRDLRAIVFIDPERRIPVNVQHALLIDRGQIATVPVSRHLVGRTSSSEVPQGTNELLLFRPPASDAYDVVTPDGLKCERLTPGSAADRASRGRLRDAFPCKQVPGIETVVDVQAWLTATGSIQGASPSSTTPVWELRGRLRSLAPGGEQVPFVLTATPPQRTAFAVQVPTRRDTVIYNLVVPSAPEPIRIETVAAPKLEWATEISMLGGPHRSNLPGGVRPTYRARRYKGDVTTTLRWRTESREQYELTIFGSTQVTLSDTAPGDHNDVPYGGRFTARFGKDTGLGFHILLEGAYEDDPFQENTLAAGDQRIRLLAGINRVSPWQTPWEWGLSLGPTYFVDRPTVVEPRPDVRELGYSAMATVQREGRLLRIPGFLEARMQVYQSWGYVQDAGNSNLTLTGRVGLKPRVRVGASTVALGPVTYLSYHRSDYAVAPRFTESNVQVGLELSSNIRF